MVNSDKHKLIIHNCHIHSFTKEDVPSNFIPMGLVRWLSNYSVRWARFLNNRFRRTDSDVYDRYANFLRLMSCEKQEQIFDYLRQFYPRHTLTRFVILSMDMAKMKAGKLGRKYTDQLDDLKHLKTKYKNDEFTEIFPFICVDPRRDGITALVEDYVDNNGFCGLKLYPPLGYFPYDARLDEIYKIANKKSLPIIAHCSKSGPVYFREKKKKIIEIINKGIDSDIGIIPKFKGKNSKELCNYFTHPSNYSKILKKYKKLRLCLAHFGGASQWDKFLNPSTVGVCEEKKKDFDDEESWYNIIYDLLKDPKHKNLYSDISFTLSYRDYIPLLKILLLNQKVKNKILYGTDFYMTEIHATDRRFGIDIRSYLGEDDFKLIAVDTPMKFLGLQ